MNKVTIEHEETVSSLSNGTTFNELDWPLTGISRSQYFLQVFDDTSTPPSNVSVLDHDVEVVDSFVYLGSCIGVHGGSERDICRRIEKARSCMKSQDRNIWRSSISLQTKIRLYNVYILPILLYGADTWSMTVASSRRLDAFDQWCLRRIVHIPCTAHITNEEVRRRTGQPPVTSVISKRRLRLFGHLARSRPITRPLAHSSSSHQSSSSGLATPGRSTKADMAPCNRARPSAPQHWS